MGIRDILTHLAADVHGASRHTDITRSIWVPARPSMVAREGATATTLGSVPNDNETVALADGLTQGVGFDVVMPKDAKAASPLLMAIYWAPAATDAASHAVQWEATFKARVAGDDVTAGGTTTTFTGVAAPRTQSLLVITPATQVLAACSADDYVPAYLRRLAAVDPPDTYVGTVQLLGVRLDYTAVQ